MTEVIRRDRTSSLKCRPARSALQARAGRPLPNSCPCASFRGGLGQSCGGGLSFSRYCRRRLFANAAIGLACRSVTAVRVFNGSSSTNFTFSPRCGSGLQVAARIGEAARGLQCPQFSMKSSRIPAWQHSSRELSCSLPQPSSAKRMKTGERAIFR